MAAVITAAVTPRTTPAKLALAPSHSHVGTGLGIVVDDVPVATADLKIGISSLYWDRQFMDPTSSLRTSVELGLYGFYLLLPIPQVSANMYFGSEENTIQGKLGVGGFYDVSVGGHAGLMVKTGVILKNRFDISFLVVPTGTDSEESYGKLLGLDSEQEASENYRRNGNQHVVMPYYGMLVSIRY
jgi:hypothetical protein